MTSRRFVKRGCENSHMQTKMMLKRLNNMLSVLTIEFKLEGKWSSLEPQKQHQIYFRGDTCE